MNRPSGGVAWPMKSSSSSAFDPQHTTEPSVFTPHVWADPALTEANANGGGVACSLSSEPQHTTEPSVFTPHVWWPPALTDEKVPCGNVVWPEVLRPSTRPSRPSSPRRSGSRPR